MREQTVPGRKRAHHCRYQKDLVPAEEESLRLYSSRRKCALLIDPEIKRQDDGFPEEYGVVLGDDALPVSTFSRVFSGGYRRRTRCLNLYSTPNYGKFQHYYLFIRRRAPRAGPLPQGGNATVLATSSPQSWAGNR